MIDGFKVGDRVRIVKTMWGAAYRPSPGETGVIVDDEYTQSHEVCVEVDGRTSGWYFKKGEVELVKEPTTGFAIGDTVRVIDGGAASREVYAEVATGWIGIVKDVKGDRQSPYRVIFEQDPHDDDYGWWLGAEHLERVYNVDAVEVMSWKSDSPQRIVFTGGGMRDSQAGKPRFDLLVPVDQPFEQQFLTRCAVHMAKGAEKYEDRNWEKFSDQEAYDRAKASALRHMFQWLAGDTDEDHAAAVFFNLMAAEFVKDKL